jgi:sigma-E factor negative regulatory protein RseA
MGNMTENFERISALVDDETQDHKLDDQLLDSLKKDDSCAQKWYRYHLIGQVLRQELPEKLDLNLGSNITTALVNEPSYLPSKRPVFKLPQLASIIPLFKQGGQLAIAASVAVAVVVGVQSFNQPDELRPYNPAVPQLGPQGGLAPVSLQQTRSTGTLQAIEQRRLINAYFFDHQRQLKQNPLIVIKENEITSPAAEREDLDENQQQ